MERFPIGMVTLVSSERVGELAGGMGWGRIS